MAGHNSGMAKESVMPKRPGVRLTREQCRAVDRYAIERLAIPGVVLMENAGRHAADLIDRWLCARLRPVRRAGRVVILCGRGNNGGDGFVIARHLTRAGHAVSVDLLARPDDLTGGAAVNHTIAVRMKLPVRYLTAAQLPAAARRWAGCDVLVDALLGTGFAGQVREPLASVITRINRLRGPLVVAVDVPSGLDANTGLPGGVAVRAHRTVTFLARKVGFAEESARRYVGRVTVADIGVPLGMVLERLRTR